MNTPGQDEVAGRPGFAASAPLNAEQIAEMVAHAREGLKSPGVYHMTGYSLEEATAVWGALTVEEQAKVVLHDAGGGVIYPVVSAPPAPNGPGLGTPREAGVGSESFAVSTNADGATNVRRLPELPRYRSHKVVEGARIYEIKTNPWALVLDVPGYPTLRVSDEYMQKHKPYVGGYYVRYEDGYESFSPAAAFEGGYTRLDERGEVRYGADVARLPNIAAGFAGQVAMDGSPAFVAVSLFDLQRAGKFKELPLGAEDATVIAIQWQCGPLQEVGVNGCSIEDVIDVLIARLEGFQGGGFACPENAQALWHQRKSKGWLLARTAARQAQGVEGTNTAHQS